MANALNDQPRYRRTEIEMERDDDEPDGVKFEFNKDLISSILEGKQREKYKNDGRPGFLIDFVIKDDDGTGLLFPKDKAEAMWVHPVADKDDPCPPRRSTWDEFRAVEVRDDGRTLRVRNCNRRTQLFKFSLNFTRDRNNPHAEPICWDPIGDNRNGHQQLQRSAVGTVAIVAGLALIAVAAAVSQRTRGGRRH